ncbi:MAG TPA: gamma-glutamyltransferase, partial [Verrucomicrobiae bacterium]|nr:gamma-glutamyltransferase [Verrucomicrobiae bacterium]
MRIAIRHFLPSSAASTTPASRPALRPRETVAVRRALAIFFCALTACASNQSPAEYTHGVVASVSPAATEAGVRVLKQGGNAIDAAVAVGLTLGVVDGENSGIGGGCLMLIRRANGKIECVDGRETAPGRATRDMFLKNGKGDTELSQVGALASGVPGALAAYDYALRHFGSKGLKELILPAAALAEQGFVVSEGYAARLKGVASELQRFDATREIYCRDGKPIAAGEVLRQPDLARTYRNIAEHGARWFYRGPFARVTEEWMRAHGGIMTEADFRHYKPIHRSPVLTTYRGYEIAGFPPPSSGGIHVAEILNILENFDLKNSEPGTRLHLIAEAMKLAFADRAYWLGDSAFARVPRGLLDKGYAKSLAAKINPEHVTPVLSHGTPPNATTDIFKHQHTTHFCVADAQGNWVACTATINTTLGSKVVIPGTGVVMNNEMDDFSVQPGVRNFFGLVGAEANAVAPGKRPLSSMSPTIALRDGKPVIAIGAAGGPTIITSVLLGLVDMIDLGQDGATALRQPR